jgi:hypothetical protein
MDLDRSILISLNERKLLPSKDAFGVMNVPESYPGFWKRIAFPLLSREVRSYAQFHWSVLISKEILEQREVIAIAEILHIGNKNGPAQELLLSLSDFLRMGRVTLFTIVILPRVVNFSLQSLFVEVCRKLDCFGPTPSSISFPSSHGEVQ